MEIKFDARGLLMPYKRIELSLESFEENFVTAFEKASSRGQIFENYKRFISAFREQVSPKFIQWINGSFVSNKQNPRDIDFVTIIDYEIFTEKEKLIEDEFRLKGAKEKYAVDAYTIRKYSEVDAKYLNYQHELVYWDSWFSQTKKNRAKKKFQKGYIQISFGNSRKILL